MSLFKKRFIAGAVCPQCAEIDKLTLQRDDCGNQHRECVRCGYRDVMSAEGKIGEVPTRVNQPRIDEQPLAHEEEVQSIKFISD